MKKKNKSCTFLIQPLLIQIQKKRVVICCVLPLHHSSVIEELGIEPSTQGYDPIGTTFASFLRNPGWTRTNSYQSNDRCAFQLHYRIFPHPNCSSSGGYGTLSFKFSSANSNLICKVSFLLYLRSDFLT